MSPFGWVVLVATLAATGATLYLQQTRYPHTTASDIPRRVWLMGVLAVVGWLCLTNYLAHEPGFIEIFGGLYGFTAQVLSNPLRLVQDTVGTYVLEWMAFGAAIFAAIITIRQSLWSWILGVLPAGFMVYLGAKQELWSMMVLHGFFAVTQLYGFHYWVRYTKSLSGQGPTYGQTIAAIA